VGAPDEEAIDPEAQALNEAQDRRLEVQARISEATFRAKEKLEADLNRRYGGNIRQLDGEIKDLQKILDNSGPVRLAWLKLTRRVSQDPQRDLNLLQSTKRMYESYRSEARHAFANRIRDEAQVREPGAQPTAARERQNAQAADSTGRAPLSKEQAAERIEYLEGRRPKPVAELHLRPGGKTEEFVHADAAVKLEAEISGLKALLKAHDGPARAPDPDSRGTAVQDLDDGFELLF
jgi:hypothetical protein